MFGGGGLFGGRGNNQQNQQQGGFQNQQQPNQQQQYNQQGMNNQQPQGNGINRGGMNQMTQGGGGMMNQGMNQTNMMGGQQGLNQPMNQQQNMVRFNNQMPFNQNQNQNNLGGGGFNNAAFNNMMPQQQQQQQNNFQPNMQQNFQQQQPMQQQQQQNFQQPQPLVGPMVHQPQQMPGQMLTQQQPTNCPPLQYVSAPFGQQQQFNPQQQPANQGLVVGQGGQPLVVQPAGQPAQAPTYVISSQPQTSFLQQAGGQVQGGQQVVLAPPGTSNLVTSQHPASSQLVVVQPTSQPAPQVVQLVTSSGQPLTATPAPFLSAPTPQPIVVSQTVPLQSSSTNPPNPQNYTFDPAGLTPAQQLAYAQAQQQHQQQHLKKMRQRLPHVSGRELSTLQKQIKDLQHKQHLQTVQTLRLAQVQEKQAFNYLDTALKTRQPKNTYHRVGFHLKVLDLRKKWLESRN